MIVSLITLYYPNFKVIDNVKSVCAQSDVVYLCDNSPTDNSAMFSSLENIVYKFFNKNLGLSAAFNTVLKNEKFSDDDFIIFFDQDSTIQDNHINILIHEYESLEKMGVAVGCLGPVYRDELTGKYTVPWNKTNISPNTVSTNCIITSSMLCKFITLKRINFWNENIFLDMADWDFCWRLNAIKLKCCLTRLTILGHTFGEHAHKLLSIQLQEGKPFRLYYQVRDGLKLFFKKYTPMKFRVRFIRKLTIKQIAILLFMTHKKEYIKYYFKGIYDYLLNINEALDNK